MKISVRTKSLFRAYTEPNAVDIDFSMKAGAQEIAHDIFESGAEKMVLTLEPGTDYIFTVYYYYDFDLLEDCSVRNI